jgi:hypothetical protein
MPEFISGIFYITDQQSEAGFPLLSYFYKKKFEIHSFRTAVKYYY